MIKVHRLENSRATRVLWLLEKPGLDQRYPNTHAYIERVNARPAYKKAVEKGGARNVPT